MEIKKILVPVVFLDGSLRVVQQAVYLARHFRSEILLVHVVEPPSYAEAFQDSNLWTVQDAVTQRAKEDLEQSLEHEFEGVAVERRLLQGRPAREIMETARSENADLIVMGTHGYGPFYRLLLGSVTAKVLHETECPVWTGAHLEEAPPGEFAVRSIVCAMDLTEHSVRTLRRAAEFAKEFGARLTAAHVTGSVEAFGPGGSHEMPAWKKELTHFANEEIAKLQQEAGTHVETIVESGNVPTGLGRIVERTKADLLITGRAPGRGHLGANGEGYSIIRDARVPVLSL